MDAKPKRKNAPDKNAIEFVTALSLDECVARLERGPTRTLDHRLSVRIDGVQFVIDAQEEIKQFGLRVVAELHGEFIPCGDEQTLVRAHRIRKLPPVSEKEIDQPTAMAFTVGVGIITGLILSLIVHLLLGLTVGPGVTMLMYLGWMTLNEWDIDQFNQNAPDLGAWLREHLFEHDTTNDIAEWEAFDGHQTETQKHAG